MKNSESDNKRHQMADLEAIARSLQNDPDTAVNVPVVVISGIIIAFIMLSFAYVQPLWISLGLIVLLGAVIVVSYTRRPPVAPLESAQGERERIHRVLSEHGIRPAVTLVRALYPEESSAAAAHTIKLLSNRMLVEQGDQDRRGQRLVVGFLQKLVALSKRGMPSAPRYGPCARLIDYE